MPFYSKLVNDTDPLKCRLSLIIRDLSLETKVKDLNTVIRRHLALESFQISFGQALQ